MVIFFLICIKRNMLSTGAPRVAKLLQTPHITPLARGGGRIVGGEVIIIFETVYSRFEFGQILKGYSHEVGEALSRYRSFLSTELSYYCSFGPPPSLGRKQKTRFWALDNLAAHIQYCK
jgi:hypothetical protein